MRGKPGQRLDIAAAAAPSAAAAAHYYPAIYWYSLLKIPDKKEFGGENGIPAGVTQQDWLTVIKNRACVGCHQLGQESTRTIPAAFSDLGSEEAWMRRVQSGQAAQNMINPLGRLARRRAVQVFRRLDRSHRQGRAAARQAAPAAGDRAQRRHHRVGLEPTGQIPARPDSADRRYPTISGDGKLWGSPEYATDELPILDPKTHTVSYFRTGARREHATVLGPGTPPPRSRNAVGLLGRQGDLGHPGQQPQHR